jgi:prophage regulatory protein
MVPKIRRLKTVLDITGKGRSQLYKDIVDGTFPRGVKIGPRAVGWPENEIETINAARIGGASQGELKKLVQRLHAERGSQALRHGDLTKRASKAGAAQPVQAGA